MRSSAARSRLARVSSMVSPLLVGDEKIMFSARMVATHLQGQLSLVV